MGVVDLKEFSFQEIKTKNYDLGKIIILFHFLKFKFCRVLGAEFGWEDIIFDWKESILGQEQYYCNDG